MMQAMNLFITGSSGFIGRNLAEYFSQKFKVYAPSHKELELLDEDAVRDFFRKHNIDIVIHSAFRPGHRNAGDASNQLNYNCRMFFNIVRNSQYFKKMIFLSSGLAYDLRNYKPGMREDYFDSHVPIDEAGFSKYICAKYIERFDNIIELRIFGLFGKYEDYSIRFISNAICKTLFDLPITIKQNRRFDYLYVDDLMAVIDYFIFNNVKFKAYNVTSGNPIELVSLAEKIKARSKKDSPIIIAQDGMGVEYSGDNERLRKEILHINFTPVDEAIDRLYRWYTENRNSIKKEVLLSDK